MCKTIYRKRRQGPAVAAQNNDTTMYVTRSPVCMDTGDRTPSPIVRNQDVLSQQDNDNQIYNETTVLEATGSYRG